MMKFTNLSKLGQQIIQAIDAGINSPGALVEHTGYSDNTIRVTLYRFCKLGIIERTARAEYRVAAGFDRPLPVAASDA